MQVQSYSLSSGQTIDANRQLAEKIIAAKGKEDKCIQVICSTDFVIDPTAHLINEMIKRNVGMCCEDDCSRAFIMGQIPDFMEKVCSPDYLRSFAVSYFKNDPNRLKIIQIFERSLLNDAFQSALKDSVEYFNKAHGNYFSAESSLRNALTIFGQSAQLQEYAYPVQGGFE